MLRSNAITRISGKFSSTKSTDPSSEPLSTRIVSKSLNVCHRKAERHVSRKCFPFQLITMTVIAGIVGDYELGFQIRTGLGKNLIRALNRLPETVWSMPELHCD